MGFVIACATSAWLLLAVVAFARTTPGYDHVRDAISTLAERGSKGERPVSYGVFLPVGLAALALGVHLMAFRQDLLKACAALLAFSIATGYLAAVVAPLEPSGAVSTSAQRVRSWVHILGATLEYSGGALALMGATWLLPLPWATLTALGALAVVTSALVLVRPQLLPFRGAIQRAAEVALFCALIWLSRDV